MKHIYTSALRATMAILLALVSCTLAAKDFTYDFSSSVPSAWTSTPAPFGYETASPARGTQYTSNATLTLKGMTNVTKVVITCSCNVAGENSIALAVGGSTWGSETLAKESNVEKTFTGAAATGDVVISITRSSKSVYISRVVVTAEDGSTGGGDTGDGDGEKDDDKQLDPSYKYGEPTIVTPSGDLCSNTAYSFVQNNVKVETTTGAQTATYFGCNAGNSITFTATQPIYGIAINGYVKKDFAATTTAGDIVYVDASEDYVEANPVAIIYDINSKSVTIECEKQLRCYSVELYFNDNPDAEIDDPWGDDGGEYTYEYEPTTASKLNIAFDYLEYADYSELAGYPYTDLYFDNDKFILEAAVFQTATPGTAIAPGTYAITDTYDEGTVQASPGGDDYYDYPTYIATDFDEEGYYMTSYYIVSGTLTVANDPAGVKMTLVGKTYYGSTVNATFVGKPVKAGDDSDAIDGIEAATKTASGKMVRDGKIVIVKNGRTYNTAGQIIK